MVRILMNKQSSNETLMTKQKEKKRSDNPHKFFSANEKQKIIAAIRAAEKETSGEIRVHLEEQSRLPVFDRAVEVFHMIGMNRTALKNGVLIYLATTNKEFAVLGDSGINQAVPKNFWDEITQRLSEQFAGGNFCEGLCEAILLIGEKLKTYFPHKTDDQNELSDDISIHHK